MSDIASQMVQLPTDRWPARELANLIGEDQARTAIRGGWDALRSAFANRPDLVHPGVGDYIAATVLLGALPGMRSDPNAGTPDAPVTNSAFVGLRPASDGD